MTENRTAGVYVIPYGQCSKCAKLFRLKIKDGQAMVHTMVAEIPDDRPAAPKPVRTNRGPHGWMGR